MTQAPIETALVRPGKIIRMATNAPFAGQNDVLLRLSLQNSLVMITRPQNVTTSAKAVRQPR
jgi:hypothetical protein